MKETVNELIKLIGPENCEVVGDRNRKFSNITSIYDAKSDDLTFCNKKGDEAISLIKNTEAGVIICDLDIKSKGITPDNKTLLFVRNPRFSIIQCIETFFPPKTKVGIHPLAVIGKNCEIGENVYIGPYAVIDNNVIIGNGTKIDSGTHIYDNVRIGHNVSIKSGCVIGSDGYSYEKKEDGTLEKFPHLKSVIIEDDVDIGANTCIDRGSLSETIIGQGTKIDNLVHIAHNVEIGKNCLIIALSCIAGSVKIGDGAWIAPQACIRNGITIGEGATVGMGAVVTKDVEPYDIVIGVPARSMKKTS